MMVKTKLFKSNQSQAVRLPKAVAFPEEIKDVQIIAIDHSRLISPVDQSWDLWFDGPSVTEDYMIDRDQGGTQDRESL